MIRIKDVFSLKDPELQIFTALTESQLRNRLEPEKGIFIAESPKVIKLALQCGLVPISLLTEVKSIDGQASEIISMLSALPELVDVYVSNENVLKDLTGYELYRGVLCAMKRPPRLPLEAVLENASRIAVLENIADATNIGAIFRSAAALGLDAVLLTPNCCDALCRRAIRVSMGTVFQIAWTYICDDRDDWEKNGMDILHRLGFKTAAMVLSENTIPIDDPKLAEEKKLAFILGSEGDGLAASTVASCDYNVKIPMYNGVDSLNVAAASAVAFWELRKRK